MFKRFLMAAVLLTMAFAVQARTWVLANGDHLTGDLIAETDESVVIVHPQLGRITLARSALSTAPAPGPAVPAAKKAADTIAQSAKWKRQLEFGYASASGQSSSQNLSVRVQLDKKDGPDTYQATSQVLEADADGVTSSDLRSADFRWRHELTAKVFTQSLSTWQSEPVRQLDNSVEQQVGGGVKVLASGPQTANIGLGAAVRYQARTGIDDETAVLGTVFQDYAVTWKNGIRLSEGADVALANDRPYNPASGAVGSPAVPADGGNYRVRFNTLFQGKVTPQMTVNLRYDFDYDRSLPDPASRLARRLTTSLGYLW